MKTCWSKDRHPVVGGSSFGDLVNSTLTIANSAVSVYLKVAII